ncbi:MAG: dodecin family protein [Pseudomonadota bacterium]
MERAAKTSRGITGFHVIEQKAMVANGNVSQYRLVFDRSLRFPQDTALVCGRLLSASYHPSILDARP